MGALQKTPSQLMAEKIGGQVAAELNLTQESAAYPIALLENSIQLMRAHKVDNDSPHAQAFRYIHYRKRHAAKYETVQGIAEADKDFIRREEITRDRKGPHVKAYGLWPVHDLKIFIDMHPHILTQSFEDQQRLHDELRRKGLVKAIDGVEHVALSRRYPHPHALPELIASSFSDSGIPIGVGQKGAYLGFATHRWVPLSEVLYNYDFGHRSAYATARRGAQDETVVDYSDSPIPAKEEDVKKLFPSSPKPTPEENKAVKVAYRLPRKKDKRPEAKKFHSLGAGAIIYAKDTGRFLIGQRSADVDDPELWGTWGGQIFAEHEKPEEGALREIREETGYKGPMDFHHIFTAESQDPKDLSSFLSKKYHNFIGTVDKEFTPDLNEEHKDARWVDLEQIPKNWGYLHPGLNALLNHPKFLKTAEKFQRSANVADWLKSPKSFNKAEPSPNRFAMTKKGTVIKRSKLGVGKDIGGAIYLHRDYEDHIPDQEGLLRAKQVLDKNHPGFKYNALKVAKDKFTFFNSPDFDTAHEPVAGNYITVSGDKSKAGNTSQIWHHKWLWVKEGYRGFDVDASHRRSLAWLKIPNIDFARIGNKEFWESKYVPKIPIM
jgi:8-oxo-dGTP pyrophosphatase MutT (NUDIX family)